MSGLENNRQGVSRREFFAFTGAAGIALSLPGCGGQKAQDNRFETSTINYVNNVADPRLLTITDIGGEYASVVGLKDANGRPLGVSFIDFGKFSNTQVQTSALLTLNSSTSEPTLSNENIALTVINTGTRDQIISIDYKDGTSIQFPISLLDSAVESKQPAATRKAPPSEALFSEYFPKHSDTKPFAEVKTSGRVVLMCSDIPADWAAVDALVTMKIHSVSDPLIGDNILNVGAHIPIVIVPELKGVYEYHFVGQGVIIENSEYESYVEGVLGGMCSEVSDIVQLANNPDLIEALKELIPQNGFEISQALADLFAGLPKNVFDVLSLLVCTPASVEAVARRVYNELTYQANSFTAIVMANAGAAGHGQAIFSVVPNIAEQPPQKIILDGAHLGRSTSISCTPNDPAPSQGYTFGVNIICPARGGSIVLKIIGTDGYSDERETRTDNAGVYTLSVPGGEAGVQDFLTATIKDPTGVTLMVRQRTIVF